MDIVSEVLHKAALEAEKYKPISVEKHLDVELDLGTLMALDPNDLDLKALKENPNLYVRSITRDSTQLLFNKVWELPTERVEEAIVARLPEPKFVLPRSKPVPQPKPLTKWQKFAKEKGIQKKKKARLSWDEQLKKWVPLYGFKRATAQKEKEWVLEVPDRADPMEDQFEKQANAKSERIAKNELQRLRNIAKAKNVKVPRMGLVASDKSSAKQLSAAVTISKASTASLGKFEPKLPKNAEARGISSITPGTSRKRKLPVISGPEEKKQSLAVVDLILNKKPKIDIEGAVARRVHENNPGSEDASSSHKAKKNKKKTSSQSRTKPKGRKGKHVSGKRNVGRKRR